MVTINGKEFPFSESKTILQFFAGLNRDIARGVAIAINNAVIPKTNWNTHAVNNNDTIIVIKATQGG